MVKKIVERNKVNEGITDYTRPTLDKVMELVDEGILDPKWCTLSLLKYLGEDEVKDWAKGEDISLDSPVDEGVTQLTTCPNCGAEKFNDKTGLCVDCGYDENSWGELDEDSQDKPKSRISYKGYIIKRRKDPYDKDEFVYDVIKPSWSTVEPVWEGCETIELAKEWIDSDKADDLKSKKKK